jgi:hypothetical protein
VNDFVSKFDLEFAPKLGVRAHTFRAVLREAITLDAKNIVETGCMRKAGNWQGDGQSTLIWAAFNHWKGSGYFNSVDLNQEAVDLAREAIKDYSGCQVFSGDSVKFLYDHKLMIDILYLDSYDVDMANPEPAAQHCLFELLAAMPRLHKNSIVFIDDSPVTNGDLGGKGLHVARFMKHLGILPFTFDYQVAWLMP